MQQVLTMWAAGQVPGVHTWRSFIRSMLSVHCCCITPYSWSGCMANMLLDSPGKQA
jgi:hypothetical protein